MTNNQVIDTARSGALDGMSNSDRFIVRDREAATKTLWVVMPVLMVTTVYAIIRYNIVGITAWHQLPIFVINKGVAWGALVVICVSLSMGALSRIAPTRFKANVWLRKYIGLAGFGLASLHMLMSFFILDPGYFPRFYLTERMTGLAEMTMLMGAISWLLLWTLVFASLPTVAENMSRHYWLRWQQLAGLCAAVLGGLHVLYGFAGWFQPENWSGGLPPITLLSALTVVVMLIVRAVGKRERAPQRLK